MASIFATPVWTFKPARGKAIAERLATYLKDLRDADPKGSASGKRRGLAEPRRPASERRDSRSSSPW